MAITYNVQAEVVDLGSDTPRAGDAFFVDTNVWYWLTYTRSRLAYRKPKGYQVRDYPAYIKQARAAKAKLFTCGLCFSELANSIEKNEWKNIAITNQPKEKAWLLRFKMLGQWLNPLPVLLISCWTNLLQIRLATTLRHATSILMTFLWWQVL